MRFTSFLVATALSHLTSVSAVLLTSRALPAGLQNDLEAVGNAATKANDDVVAFPNTGGSLLQALTIHTDLTTLNSGIQNLTTDIHAIPLPLSTADGTTIVEFLEGSVAPPLVPLLTENLPEKILVFQQSGSLNGVAALVQQDLQTTTLDSVGMLQSIVAVMPTFDLQQRVEAIIIKIQQPIIQPVTGS